jgi:hypothetical protein
MLKNGKLASDERDVCFIDKLGHKAYIYISDRVVEVLNRNDRGGP